MSLPIILAICSYVLLGGFGVLLNLWGYQKPGAFALSWAFACGCLVMVALILRGQGL